MGNIKSKAIILFLLIFSFFVFIQKAEASSVIDYAPNFWFDSEEKYYPTNPLDFYYNQNLEELPGEIAKQKYDNLSLEEKIKNITVFYEIKETEKEIIYQYWMFYVFNQFDVNEHFGDFESVFVFVNKITEKANRIVGSAHHGAELKIIFANNELENPEYNHTTILVERGSHANCPDANDNGLFEKTEDITNWYNAYAFLGFRDYSHGLKIQHNNLNLKPISEIKQKEKLINKSPTLGSLPVTIFNKKIYLAPKIGGSPPTAPWQKEVYHNPEKIRPITKELAVEKVKKFVSKAKEKIVGVFKGEPKQASVGAGLQPAQNKTETEHVLPEQEEPEISISETIEQPKITPPKISKSAPESQPKSEPKIQPEPQVKAAPTFIYAGGSPNLCQEITCNDACYDNNIWSYKCDPNTGNCIINILKESCDYGCENSFCLPEPEPEGITPPTTSHNINTQIEWHTQDVNIILSAEDDIDQNPIIFYRLNSSEFQQGSNFIISEDGIYLLEFYSQDEIGNKEETQQIEIKIDKATPSSAVNALEEESEDTEILLSWTGQDNVNGSGILDYNISYKQNSQDWQIFLENATSTQAAFQAECCHTYYFRSRARDQAGNLESWPEIYDTKIDIVDNTAPPMPVLTSPQAENNFILTNASTTQLLGTCSEDTDIILINAATITPAENQWSYNLSLENATTSLRIFAQDEAGNQSQSLDLEIASDVLAPNTITYISQDTSTPGLVRIIWNAMDNLSDVYNSGFKQVEIFYKKDNQEYQLWQRLLPEEVAHPFIEDYYFTQLNFQTEQGHEYQLKTLTYDNAGNAVEWQSDEEIYFADVRINEIAWMGTQVSSSDEWIELYNNASSTVVLDGWTLEAYDGTPLITLEKSIEPDGYFLLERSDDNSVPGITADQIYTGALENNGETLFLRNSQDMLIELLDFGDDWPAGDNIFKTTMEKASDGTWQTSLNIHGTPRHENSQ